MQRAKGEARRWQSAARTMRPLLALALFAFGCGRPDEPPPEPYVDFAASVEVHPAAPTLGRRVTFVVEVVNTGNAPAEGNLSLQVVGKSGKLSWKTTWEGVQLAPNLPLNLTHGFIVSTDAEPTQSVDLSLASAEGELLFETKGLAELRFYGDGGR